MRCQLQSDATDYISLTPCAADTCGRLPSLSSQMENKVEALRERVIAAIDERPDLSFSGLARALGLSRQWGSMLKKRRRFLHLKHVDRAAAYVGRTSDELLGYDSLDTDPVRQAGRGKQPVRNTVSRKAGAHDAVSRSHEARLLQADNNRLRRENAGLHELIDRLAAAIEHRRALTGTAAPTPTVATKSRRGHRGRD